MATATTPDTPLTPRQRLVLDVILAFWRRHGRPPAVRDVGKAMKIISPNGVCCHLRSLAKRGLIEADAGPWGIYPTGYRERIASMFSVEGRP